MLKSKTLCAPMAKTITRPSPAALDVSATIPEQDQNHSREGIEVRDQPENSLLDIERQVGAVGFGQLLRDTGSVLTTGSTTSKVPAPTPKTMPLSRLRALFVDRQAREQRAMDIAHPVDPRHGLQRDDREREDHQQGGEVQQLIPGHPAAQLDQNQQTAGAQTDEHPQP